ncbi:acetyltransferase [Raphidocelis subcapitata]|uniref:Acetyltransferase n=1 Tax=Raphidocelis subcapitata TaxID=307507 RepID=A0A2V0NXF3_9CHLO|nr:acetyltransferase [Raphidocelis subcapitata]|eukprot:GBF92311.1 acetyltransferase [Raphidocelis subcapitata]
MASLCAASAAAGGQGGPGSLGAPAASLLGGGEDAGDANKPQPQAGGGAACYAAQVHHAPAAPSKHAPFVGGYMSAADLANLDALEAARGGAQPGSAPSSLSCSRAGSEYGETAPFVPAPGAAAAAAARALSRLGGGGGGAYGGGQQQVPATPPRPDSAASFYGGPTPAPAGAPAPAPAEPEVVSFNWACRAAGAAGRAHAEAALSTLVAAMADDPVNAYLLGGAAGGARFSRKEIKGYLRALPKAAHFISTRDAAAVALWQLMPQETPRNELLAGWTRILRVPLRRWPALVALELRYEAAHAAAAAAAPGGSWYYLSFIGSAPEVRGRGYGSLLLRAITARADAEGRLALLEATSERSRSLYERHGFVTYETYRVTPSAPAVFFMRRDARPPGAATPGPLPLTPLLTPAAGVTPRGGAAGAAPAGRLGKSLVAAIAGKLGGGSEAGASSDDEGPLIPTAVIRLTNSGGGIAGSGGGGGDGGDGAGAALPGKCCDDPEPPEPR